MKFQVLIILTLSLVLFQNCAEPVDLGAYKTSASSGTNNPSTPTPGIPTTAALVSQSPATTTVLSGNPVSLFIVVTATGPIVYEWYFNNTLVPTATSDMFNIPGSSSVFAGTYYVIIKDASTKVELLRSQTFTLAVTLPQPTVFTYDPAQIESGGKTYPLVIDSGLLLVNMANAFCKVRHGATATAKTYVLSGTFAVGPAYHALYSPGRACNSPAVNLTNGFCGYQNFFAIKWSTYNVVCQL